VFPEARELQRGWVGAANVYEGMYKNLFQGLTVFNNTLHDHGYEYYNPGHGFADPVSGVLVWVGLIFCLFKLRTTKEDALLISSFAFIFLFFAIFTTKNPNYTRFLIILPFFALLIMEALAPLARLLERYWRWLGAAVAVGIPLVIAVLNLGIYGDYVRQGRLAGNDVGDTARYVDARPSDLPYHFYLASSAAYPYYSWGNESQWHTWVSYFAGEKQTVTVLDPFTLASAALERPFTVFLSASAWEMTQSSLRAAYPEGVLHSITSDQRLVALEVK